MKGMSNFYVFIYLFYQLQRHNPQLCFDRIIAWIPTLLFITIELELSVLVVGVIFSAESRWDIVFLLQVPSRALCSLCSDFRGSVREDDRPDRPAGQSEERDHDLQH